MKGGNDNVKVDGRIGEREPIHPVQQVVELHDPQNEVLGQLA